MNPIMPLPPKLDAITGGGAIEVLAARELAHQSITALATHTLAVPLCPFRPAATLYRLMCVGFLLGLLLTPVPGIAQTPEGGLEDWGSVLTTEAGLVMVPLHVYKNRESVGGLGEQAFELVEDGVVQDIAFVDGPGGQEDPTKGRVVPIEIIVLVDVKRTVRIDLLDTRKIRDSFFEGVSDSVAISVYGFADKLNRSIGPTRDIAKVQLALEMVYSSGDGHIPVVNAIVSTARDAASRTRNASRKLVVFSAGLNSWIFGEAAHSALDFEIPVYAMDLSPQAPPTRVGQTSVLKFLGTPFLLGRPRLATKGAPEDQRDTRNPRPRSVPLHKCCPLGMEMSREEELKGIDAWEQTSSRRLDWKHRQSMMARAYLKSVAKVAQNEYFVGYYPSREGDEPIARQVEVRLKSKRIGQVFGGRRLILY